jgi:putative transposase
MKEAGVGLDPKVLDELLEGVKKPEDFNQMLRGLTKSLIERALEAELTVHLGHEAGKAVGNESRNVRNGKSKKTVQGQLGRVELEIPRDRQSSFEPQLIGKGQRRTEVLDKAILSLYARGMSTRDIEAQIKELYDVDVSPTLISTVTDTVLEEVKAWQNRPLSNLYPIVYLDCIFVKLRHRETGMVSSQAVFVAVGVNLDGYKEVLGLWIERNEGAKFWLGILTELKNRGLEDVFIFCVDGLKGFPQAIEAVYPKSQVQLCMVHLLRYCLNFVPWKERKAVAADLKAIYSAATEQQAELALEAFEKQWNNQFPAIAQAWHRNWDRIIPIFDYPQDIRRAIYTTNVIESLNYTLKKVVKTRGAFPDEDSLFKVLFLAIQNAQTDWTMPIRDWKKALNWFATIFGDRLTDRMRTQNS